ncbi:1895_t:CDS:2 [Acaulospora morrowiae]|uniref:1895_t:CDS:1 n=1 Tax=Acaulospora morrowiae TaxID=94023 RepID=A0A9N9FWQ5_9GLOM|nr:1895_t:CDS:2 [Acaulospora morrowiae]
MNKVPEEEQELYSSWALLIQTSLLILALLTSYYLQVKQIRAIHETIVSIFAGMLVGLIIKYSPGSLIQKMVTFHSSYFFNLLLPPIILNSGYAMKKENFFKNLGTILTFALVGTFISAIVIGFLTAILAATGIYSLSLSFLDSMIFGSILSATDPVTVLTIFQTLKVDPQLYSIIFGESILNDATAIVLYETLKQYRGQEFYFSSVLQGIVSLLFCGITLKHYAYDNMALKTKRTTKYMFNVLAQLSENFIFIYLGLTLFTQTDLVYKPFFIFFTAIFICASRYCAVFPLSKLLNSIARYRKRDEEILPRSYSVMLFWCGLRGAVAFALAAGLKGDNANAMRATILVVVVFSVIIFGGTTSKMIEILRIKMGGSIDSNETRSSIEQHNLLSIPPVLPTASQTHWFISFDDRFLKPLFTKPRGSQHRIDDQWRSERRERGEEDFIRLVGSGRRDMPGGTNTGNGPTHNGDINSGIFKPNDSMDNRTIASDSVFSTNVVVEDGDDGVRKAGSYQSFADLSALMEHKDDESENDKPLVNL